MTNNTYTGSINITSNGGSENISVSMEVLDVPILSVNPTSLDFGINEDSLAFSIINIGSGDLEWEIAVSQDWIEANPTSGIGNETINVIVDRYGLDVGNYYGSVTITSNGGNENVSISMEVSLPTEGLVVYYPFNGNANDESGSGYDGTVYDAILTEGRFGNSNSAYSFDGIDDYIDLENTSDLNFISGGFTLVAWVNFDADNYDIPIVAKHISGNSSGYFIGIGCLSQNVNTFSFYVDSDPRLTTDETYNDGNWHFIVGIYDDSVQYQYLYVDGNLKKFQFKEYDSAIDTNILIGGFTTGYTPVYINGIIDDIRIYNRALTEAEIQALYHEGGWGE